MSGFFGKKSKSVAEILGDEEKSTLNFFLSIYRAIVPVINTGKIRLQLFYVNRKKDLIVRLETFEDIERFISEYEKFANVGKLAIRIYIKSENKKKFSVIYKAIPGQDLDESDMVFLENTMEQLKEEPALYFPVDRKLPREAGTRFLTLGSNSGSLTISQESYVPQHSFLDTGDKHIFVPANMIVYQTVYDTGALMFGPNSLDDDEWSKIGEEKIKEIISEKVMSGELEGANTSITITVNKPKVVSSDS